ncbi:unnamed protein product [Rhizoctonia solani]|uniref:Zn(2)-C6 fungal-type domain-containing protein n=1 Tax=Rhizoctonia solani TaxID=456999 RepID=A0A8H3H842_9AGAM|nr:unnamed protein product [Rhizoctonia solani]
MSIRSTTGCYACKSRRKKCDEAKPKCLRCTKTGGNCEYEYLAPTGRSTKKRTRPAPRPQSEQLKKLQKEKELHLATASKLHKNANAHTLSALFDQLFNPSLCAPLSPNITWDDIIQQYPSQPQKDTFSLDPLTGQALLLLPDPNLPRRDWFLIPDIVNSYCTPDAHDSTSLLLRRLGWHYLPELLI